MTSVAFIFFTVGIALALRLPSETRIGLFQKYGLEQAVLATMLHSLEANSPQRLDAILEILRTRSVPYKHYYDAGCLRLMDKDRYTALLASLVASGRWDERHLVLSVDCLAQCTYRESGVENFSQTEISLLGPKYLFEDFMATDLPMLSGASILADQVSTTVTVHDDPVNRRYPRVIQSCLLFNAKHIPTSFFMKPETDRPNTWMAFHYSCFDAKETLTRRDSRLFPMISWLLEGQSIHELWEGVDWESMEGVADVTRWSLHVILILLGFSSHQDTGGKRIGAPLHDHLQELYGIAVVYLVNEHRRLVREALSLLLTVIISGLQHREKPICSLNTNVLLGVVVVGLPERLHPTWRLTALSFAKEVGGLDPTPYAAGITEDLKRVGPIEQIVWIQCYLGDPERYEFLRGTLVEMIKSDSRLQESILKNAPSYSRGTPQQQLFLHVPLAMRLKVARLRFLQSPLLDLSAALSYTERNQVYTEFLGSPHFGPAYMVRMMLLRMRRKHMYRIHHPLMTPGSSPTYMLELMPCHKMAKLGFVLALAALFGVNTGFPLSQHQLQILLHTYIYPEELVPLMVERHFQRMSHMDVQDYHDGLAVKKVRASQIMARQILPSYLEWQDISLCSK